MGLLVYQIDNTPGFYYYDGSGWRVLSSSTSTSASLSQLAQSQSLSEVATPISLGKNQLNNGTTFIKFDSPKDDFENIIIQIQAEGDCNGLFISKKTREGFEVKELQKGKSNVKFSYSINQK